MESFLLEAKSEKTGLLLLDKDYLSLHTIFIWLKIYIFKVQTWCKTASGNLSSSARTLATSKQTWRKSIQNDQKKFP